MTLRDALATSSLAILLACGATACGKYGPPQRLGSPPTPQAADDPNAACEDEQKQP